MSLLANSNAIETGGYQISRSVRIRASATPYFDRTPSSTSGNNTWTFSCWVKRGSDIGSTSTQESIIGAGDGGGAPARYDVFGFYNDTIQFFTFNGSAASIYTTAVFRDPSAWYHLVCRYDDTQATASNRVRIYVNGVLQTLNSPTYPNQNYGSNFNTTYLQRIAANTIATNRGIDGYLAEVIMVSGQSLDPSSFGETDTITGSWVAKKYTGTYGTNGFYLNFSDNSAATSTTIGKDYSGNGNNWTPNNISVTAGSTYDSMTDVPTLTSATAANFAVINPLSWRGSAGTVSNGNLQVVTPVGDGVVYGSMCFPSSGKWYYEFSMTAGSQAWSGIAIQGSAINTNNVYYLTNGQKYVNGAGSSYGASWTTNDIIGVAVDCDNNQITFYKNNVSQGAINYTLNTGEYAPAFADGDNATITSTQVVTFGQRPLTYSPPSGFKTLCATNLPTPTIVNGASYMGINLWTGNGSSQTLTNSGGFAPDFVWVKERSSTSGHTLYDTIRGATKYLESNATAAEGTDATTLTAFNSNGFSVGSSGALNENTQTYVGWQWKAGGTPAVTNTAGSITSTVSANTTSGFSIVTYTGNGNADLAAATIGHGLGVTPAMIITKNRIGINTWNTYHASIGNTGAVQLQSTAAIDTNQRYWNNTSPTSSVFSVCTNGTGYTNANNVTYVAYCFAAIPGYSAFGKYTGNGSTDGPFVYCGFRPKYVMIKLSSNAGEGWILNDTSRSPYNVCAAQLQANSSGAEVSGDVNTYIDILSNGFKIRTTAGSHNTSNYTYIYAAFAENPLKFSNAR